MTTQEIKTAVDRGQKVYWKTYLYPVIKDSKGQYLIHCDGGSCIGLTWQDGVTLNGKAEDFFIKIETAQDVLTADLSQLSITQLNDLYESVVGYKPSEDSPAIGRKEIITLLIGHAIEVVRHDNDFLCGIDLPDFDFAVYLTWRGGPKVTYYAIHDSGVLFHGDDFRPSPLQSIGGLDTVVSLLGFLTIKEGDTDKEYFAGYTPAQLAWSRSHACEQLGGIISDYENTDGEYREQARETLENGRKGFIA